MIFVTIRLAEQLAATGAEINWWLYVVGGALVVLGIAFMIVRGKRRGDDEPLEPSTSTAAMAVIDPTVGDGPHGTTPVPTEVVDEAHDEPIFKPSDETPDEPADDQGKA